MPADMPPNYMYHVDEPTQAYVQNVERENFQTDFSQLPGTVKMEVYYNSQTPYLVEKLISSIHNELNAVPDIDYGKALESQQGRIQRDLPEVDSRMKSGKAYQAYLELVDESHSNPVANDVLFDVDNEIIDAMPDFQDRIDDIKAEEARVATEALKEQGIMFDKDPVVESIARVSHQEHDFAVQPAIDVATLEDELTSGEPGLEVVLYRLPNDTGSMLRASVGYNQIEERNSVICRATELPVLAAYNKHVHDLVSEVPDAIAFCNAQQAMQEVQNNAFGNLAPDSQQFEMAMQKVSPTYAKYGHVSPNPLHRVEDTIAAIEYAVEYNNGKKGLPDYRPENVGQTMAANGISQPFVKDLQEAPYYFTDYTKPAEKRLISKLSKLVMEDENTIQFDRYFQKSSTKAADGR